MFRLVALAIQLHLLLLSTSAASAQAPDYADPIVQCRRLHHMDVDPNGTGFENQGCLLNCNVHGTIHPHAWKEGFACELGSICHCGECIYKEQVGHIDLEVVSARLSHEYNAYTSICLLNYSYPVTLPLQDYSQCLTCSTDLVHDSSIPVWEQVCTNTGAYHFTHYARAVFEVWHRGYDRKTFLGGATVTIDQLLQLGHNHVPVHYSLRGGAEQYGQLTTIVTWTEHVDHEHGQAIKVKNDSDDGLHS